MVRYYLCLLCLVLIILIPVAGVSVKPALADEGYLGVYVQELSRPMQIALNLEYGLLVTGVSLISPAKEKGIKEGDVLLEIDGSKLRKVHDLIKIVSDNPDRVVNIKILSKGEKKSLEIRLGKDDDTGHKWKWEWEYDHPRGHGTFRFPRGFYPFSDDEMKKLKEDIEELRENLKRLYEELNKKYREKKKKKPPEKKEQGSGSFPGEMFPAQEI